MTPEELALEDALSDPGQWQIVRPSPIHPWGAAIVSRGVIVAEISEAVAIGIEKLRAAVAEEREACAKVAEQANDCCECGDPHGPGFSEAAKAIRARA